MDFEVRMSAAFHFCDSVSVIVCGRESEEPDPVPKVLADVETDEASLELDSELAGESEREDCTTAFFS